jgi:hypothetical protein
MESRRWLFINKEQIIIVNNMGVTIINRDLAGMKILEMCGSNVEKMSGIMQNPGIT